MRKMVSMLAALRRWVSSIVLAATALTASTLAIVAITPPQDVLMIAGGISSVRINAGTNVTTSGNCTGSEINCTINAPGSAKVAYTPTVAFVGGTTPTASNVGGYYQVLGSFVCVTFFAQISYATAPTGVNFTLPFTSTNSGQFLGSNSTTATPLYGLANSSSSVTMGAFSGLMLTATGQFVSATGCYTIN